MILTILYNNDTKHEVTVQTISLVNGEAKHDYIGMRAVEMRVFRIECPDGSVPYIKSWGPMVLITYVDKDIADECAKQAFADIVERALDIEREPT